MKTVHLADVLWDAANKWLHPTMEIGWASDNAEGLCSYSCHAVQAAITGRVPKDCHVVPPEVAEFLSLLGCDGSAQCGSLLGPQQGVRYIWLLLAMHVAEDEGIMVEVAS